MRGCELTSYIYVWNNYRLAELPWDSAWTWWLAFLGVDFCYYWVHRFGHGTCIVWPQATKTGNSFYLQKYTTDIMIAHNVAHNLELSKASERRRRDFILSIPCDKVIWGVSENL